MGYEKWDSVFETELGLTGGGLGFGVQVGADIVKRSLAYPLKLIAKNAGVNGSVVVEKVISEASSLLPV